MLFYIFSYHSKVMNKLNYRQPTRHLINRQLHLFFVSLFPSPSVHCACILRTCSHDDRATYLQAAGAEERGLGKTFCILNFLRAFSWKTFLTATKMKNIIKNVQDFSMSSCRGCSAPYKRYWAHCNSQSRISSCVLYMEVWVIICLLNPLSMISSNN